MKAKKYSLKRTRLLGFTAVLILISFLLSSGYFNNKNEKEVLEAYIKTERIDRELKELRSVFLKSLILIDKYQRNLSIVNDEMYTEAITMVESITVVSKKLRSLWSHEMDVSRKELIDNTRAFKTSFYFLFNNAREDPSSSTAQRMEDNLLKLVNKTESAISVITSEYDAQLSSLADRIGANLKSERVTLFMGGIFAVLSILFIMRFIDRSSINVIKNIKDKLQLIAQGTYLTEACPYADPELKLLYRSLDDTARTIKITAREQENFMLDLDRLNRSLEIERTNAQELSLAKGQLLADISHDIRTPLNCISGFTEAILCSDSVQDIHSHARVILKESAVMLELLNDILDSSRLESGSIELNPEPFELHELLNSVRKLFYPVCVDKGIILELYIRKDVPHCIIADKLRLRQILVNLMSNAVKFTKKGGVTLSVSLDKRTDSKVFICFSVIDTGIGIHKEKLDIIFDLYKQAGADTARTFGGTGLGTNIAQRFVELMDGNITVVSEIGKGSVFSFTVPVAVCDESELESSDMRLDKPPYYDARKARILLVEDYPSNQQAFLLHLEARRDDVTIVSNGKEAVEACRSRCFDIIFMDIQMPEMDGYEATRIIRTTDGPNSDSVIIGLTADGFRRTIDKCKAYGMNHVLTKPVCRVTLFECISSCLDKIDSDK